VKINRKKFEDFLKKFDCQQDEHGWRLNNCFIRALEDGDFFVVSVDGEVSPKPGDRDDIIKILKNLAES
jgi:hypothetical protein